MIIQPPILACDRCKQILDKCDYYTLTRLSDTHICSNCQLVLFHRILDQTDHVTNDTMYKFAHENDK